jgi:hypothetical protein
MNYVVKVPKPTTAAAAAAAGSGDSGAGAGVDVDSVGGSGGDSVRSLRDPDEIKGYFERTYRGAGGVGDTGSDAGLSDMAWRLANQSLLADLLMQVE